MLKTKTTASSQAWNSNLRIRVGDTVTHLDREWTNTSGVNNEPGFNNSNWEVVKPKQGAEGKPLIDINGNLFTLDKHPNNDNLANAEVVEVNDMIIDGWWSTTEYWGKARYIGPGAITDRANWQVLDSIEEIPVL